MKNSLLLVDDEKEFLESLSLALMEEFDVRKASNGRDVLDLIDEQDKLPSLIILDLDMPEMTGVELLQKIRATGKQIPVFILTGKSSHDWAKRCADLGVQGYLDKPVDVEELISKIKKILKIDDHEFLRNIWKDDFESWLSSLSPTIRKAIVYIQENYERELTREDIAFHLDVSPQYLSSKFHKECDIQLNDYINKLKVLKCKEHLKDLDRKISDIGPSIGISDANYLTRLFKKVTGITPQEFRKKHLKP